MALIDVSKVSKYWKPFVGYLASIIAIVMWYQGKMDTTSFLLAIPTTTAWAVYHHGKVTKKAKGGS